MRLKDSRTEGRQDRSDAAPNTIDATQPPRSVDDPRLAREVLDSIQANVFLTDNEFTIVYANPRATDTLRTFEGELNRATSMQTDQVVGSNLLRLHDSPRELELQLRDPNFRT